MNRTLLVLAVSLAACSTPKGSYKGKLTSATTGQPMSGIAMVMTATPLSPEPTCQKFQVNTGPDGSFEIPGLCADSEYVLNPGVDSVLLGTPVKVKGGVPAATVAELKGWEAPKDMGVYTLTGGTFVDLVPNTQVGYYTILKSKEEVKYPYTIPTNPAAVTTGTWLVISGQRTINEMHTYPLIESGPRKFGPEDDPKKSVAWVYIGTKFASDTEFERVESKPAEGKYTDVTGVSQKGDKRVVRYIQADAFPPAWYSLMGEKAFKTYVINFGGAPAPKADAE